MASRHELNVRARAVGFDPATIPNDSKLEQKVLYLEKNATAITGTVGAQTLTISGTVSDAETVVIGGYTYTFKTALTPAAGEVLIGASDAIALDNLKSAINGTGTAGTDYAANTPVNPYVTATTNTDTTQVVEARDFSVTNASVATTETMANGSWGAATLASGAAKVVATPSAGTSGVKDTNAGLAGDKNVSV